MQLCCLLPLRLQNLSWGFWRKVEEQGSQCLSHIPFLLDISVPKTARGINSCWIPFSLSLLFLFWCLGSSVSNHTCTPEAQIYLIPWFSVSPHLFLWVLWLYSTYALNSLPYYSLSYFQLHIQFLWYISLFSDVPVALFKLSEDWFSAQHEKTHTDCHSPFLLLLQSKKKQKMGEIRPFGSGTSPNKVSIAAAWSNHWMVCSH